MNLGVSRCRRRRGRRRRGPGCRGGPRWRRRGAPPPRRAASSGPPARRMRSAPSSGWRRYRPTRRVIPLRSDHASAMSWPGGGAGERRDDAAEDAEAGVELADVVQQRGGEPAGVVGVRRCPRAAPHARATATSGGGRDAAAAATARSARGRAPTRTHATSSGRGGAGPERAKKRPERCEQLHSGRRTDELVLERTRGAPLTTPVENTSRNRTRIPYGRNRYQFGSHFSGSTRSISAEPSSGGIGSRLNRPRNRFTSANEKTIWTPSGQVVEPERRTAPSLGS